MEEAKFVSDEKPQNKALDFQYLKSKGIEYLQQLTGSFWTDYNEHDPGITILDQICYALTDLAYRTDFPIQDILHQDSKDARAFHEAHRIFPCNPLSIKDFRKLIIDSIPEIQNIWLYSTRKADSENSFQEFFQTEEENSLNGLYKMYIYLKDEVKSPEEIKQKVHKVYSSHRNLCEDVEEIVIVESVDISVFADIEVTNLDATEEILAKIYYHLTNYLNPEIHFYSLKELLTEGKKLEDVYEGVSLKHGFIKNEELLPKIPKILMSEISKIIMQVEGVVSAKNVYVQIDNKVYENQYIIPKNITPKLIFGKSRTEQDYTIKFYKGHLHNKNIERKLVDRIYNEMLSANKRVYRPHEYTIELPESKNLNLGNYFSLQHHFPLIYGVGEDGLPANSNETRVAQSKQLKAYLLFFEQFMTNYLAQLENTKQLLTPYGSTTQSYFSQILDTVPNIEGIFHHESEEKVKEPLLGNEFEIPKDYQKGLSYLSEQNDNFIDRKNRILDFLLAVHGENFRQYANAQKNFYYSEEDFEKHKIKSKVLLFQHLPKLTQNRAKAFDYLEPSYGNDNSAILGQKVKVMLGLGLPLENGEEDIFKKKSLFEPFRKSNLDIVAESDKEKADILWNEEEEPSKHIKNNQKEIERYFDYIDDEDVESISTEDYSIDEFLEKTIFFRKKMLTVDFLQNGLEVQNYRLGQFPNEDRLYLLFRYPESNKWRYIADFESYEEGLKGFKVLLNFLRDLNISSEDFYLLEHILLRPDVKDEKFGFYLLDEEGKISLKSEKRYTFKNRIEMIRKISPEVKKYENYSVERREDGDFEIHFQTSDKSIKLISLQKYISVQEIHEKMESLFNYMIDKVYIVPFDEKIAFYIQNSDKDKAVSESFYAYRMTLLFPNWNVRFHNGEFKAVLENAFEDSKPANIATKNIWLDLEKMQYFENLYKQWLEAKRKPYKENKEEINKLSNEITQFLITYYGN